MAKLLLDKSAAKKCPFCGETIRKEAIKCRFCAEFLDSRETKPHTHLPSETGDQPADTVLFEGKPSLLAMVGAAVKASLVLCVAIAVMVWPVEQVVDNIFHLGLSDTQTATFARYRIIAGLGLAVLVVCLLIWKALGLKMTSYEVTADRIEWSRGILDRQVDNIDMFRVIDLKLRRSLFDCMLGIGRVELITTDKTDPQFAFEKMRHSRGLYDIIKKASLDADRRDSVVHLE
jgi:membrane protein YdbS with pleckstrin-like domain